MTISKKELRKIMSEKRKHILTEDKKIYDKKIYDNLINSREYKNAKTIFVYVSYNDEVYTHDIIVKAIKDGKKVCVPKVISKQQGMCAIEIKALEDLKPGAYGILEPDSTSEKIDESEIDLILLPGLAFDESGGRLGYGGGFYDRFLRKTRFDVQKIGLAYELQIVENVVIEDFDEKVEKIITNAKIIKAPSKK